MVNLVLLFSLTSFIAAFLIFLVQPMIGKMLLPLVGGVPATWNTCMFFFQLLILAGYSYTHFSLRKLGVRRQSIVHLVIVAATLFFSAITVEYKRSGAREPFNLAVGEAYANRRPAIFSAGDSFALAAGLVLA